MSSAPTLLGSYQWGIYRAAREGTLPSQPVAMDELERLAERELSPGAVGYLFGGAGAEDTMRANRDAFRRWRIVPRPLRDISQRDLSTTVLGTALPAPVMVAPIGVQSIYHRDAELATARAAASVGVPLVLSTAASTTLENVAEAMGDAPRWYQLYWPKDRELALSFVRRAEQAGFEAVVVTLDTAILAWRPRDLQRGYFPFFDGEGVANYLVDPVFRAGLERSPEEDPGAAIEHFVAQFSNPALTWEDIAWLREETQLPIVLKGILHVDDARSAADLGVDGVVVSNHGGRQVDGAIAALDALPDVAHTVGDDLAVLFDSGIRTGSDAFKALALGADAVLLGRPCMWGLGVGGEDGVRVVLQSFLAELDLTFALSGCTERDHATASMLQGA